jgi:hypothetical protein
MADVGAFVARFKDRPLTIAILGDSSKFDRKRLAEFGEVVEVKADQLFAW